MVRRPNGEVEELKEAMVELWLARGSVFTVARELGDGACSAAMVEPARCCCCGYEQGKRRRVKESEQRGRRTQLQAEDTE